MRERAYLLAQADPVLSLNHVSRGNKVTRDSH